MSHEAPTGDQPYARFGRPPSIAELERFFFLDDADLALVAKRRGDHNRLGWSLQLGAVRYLGTFLADPTDVPTVVIDYLAQQVGAADPSCLKRHMARRSTRFEHAAEITAAYGYRDFAEAEPELSRWIDDRAWTTGDGPKALFDGAVVWPRERRVLLPGMSRLERLVARIRDAATQRLWQMLAALVTPTQARRLELLLEVPDGARTSDLERLRRGPTTVSGKAMAAALDRVSELASFGLRAAVLEAVPPRRVIELARWGVTGKAPALRRHPPPRKLATLAATLAHLEARATDDALELFDLLMTTELLARAQRESKAEMLRCYPQVSVDAARCATAVRVLLESVDRSEEVTLAAVWQAIETVVSGADLRAAVANIAAVTPPSHADPGGEWRMLLVERYPLVRRFLTRLCTAIEFGATAEAAPVLQALLELPGVLDGRATMGVSTGCLDARRVRLGVVPAGWWRPLVFPPKRPADTVDRAPYVFCVLEQFHQRLRRRDIFAASSNRWGDPRAQSLSGTAWEATKGPALNALGLPAEADGLLAEHAAELDAALHHVAGTLSANPDVNIDGEGRLHADKVEAIPDPPSLTDLRRRCDVGLLVGLTDGSGGAAAGKGRRAAGRAAGTDHPEGGIGMSEQEAPSTGEGGPLEEALRDGEQERKGEQENVATSGSSLGSGMDQEVELQQARGEEQQGEEPERIIPRDARN